MPDLEEVNPNLTLQNAIMNNCEEMVSVKDLDLKYVACNKAFLDMFNLNNENQVKNKRIEEILNSQNCRIIENYSKLMKTKLESNSFIITLEKQNSIRIIKMTTYPIFDNNVLSGILSISRDITNEENLKLRLIEKICMINSLLESMPMLVYMKDLDNNFLSGSKYAKDFLEKGIDIYSNNIQFGLDDIKKIVNYGDELVLNTKTSLVSELTIKSIDNIEHSYKIHKSPILDINNNVTGLLIIAQNIDVEKQLELQKELFLATLTHDLKTPLQAQISSLQLISNGTLGEINKSQKEIIDMIIESSSFMREMLYSLLSTYKYENGMVSLNKQNFNFDNLICICLKETAHLVQEKNIQFEYKNLATQSVLNADESQIRRVISNILNNAINYAYKNTKIFVVLQEYKDSFKLKIKNTSALIPEEIKQHIFDKYVSSLETQHRRGIGLGLYFCKKVIDAHNGTITLNGIGTSNEFVIELPKVQDENIVLSFA